MKTIKVIKNNKEYSYTKLQWDLAWFITWVSGLISGLIVGNSI